VRDLDLFLGAVLVGDLDVEVLGGGELVKTEDGNLVGTGDLVVVSRVLEPEGKETLLLAVTVRDKRVQGSAPTAIVTPIQYPLAHSRLVDTGE
jgi:hypothetical protein